MVTGAARGLGSSFAAELIAGGLYVAMLDVDGDTLAESAGRMAGAGDRVAALVADTTDEEAVYRSVEQTVARFGGLDVLINNAGLIFDTRTPAEALPVECWRRSLEVNATGTFLMCKAAIPHLRRSRAGRIVNVTSGLVNTGAQGRAHYVASKAAVVGLTRCLARELGRDGITVNGLAPGLIDSGPTAREFVGDEMFAFEERRRSVGARMYPGDLTSALWFLISEESRFLTGQVLVVDGGACFA
jgi:NAD(P)-dependent dehydrogenase (short-subunit alcohol dehydrogenase family)